MKRTPILLGAALVLALQGGAVLARGGHGGGHHGGGHHHSGGGGIVHHPVYVPRPVYYVPRPVYYAAPVAYVSRPYVPAYVPPPPAYYPPAAQPLPPASSSYTPPPQAQPGTATVYVCKDANGRTTITSNKADTEGKYCMEQSGQSAQKSAPAASVKGPTPPRTRRATSTSAPTRASTTRK